MKINTPSPKVLAFLIIVVSLTTITIISSKFFPEWLKNKNIDNKIDLTIKNNLNSVSNSKDSDEDGLPDWQEEICNKFF